MIRIPDKIVPLIIFEKGDKVEDITEEVAYVVAKNGIFVKKTNCLYTGLVKADKADLLGEVSAGITMKFTKLPEEMFKQIVQFFKDVYSRDSSEATVLLWFSVDTAKWVWSVPEQENGGASSNYKTDKMMFVDGTETMERITPDFKMAGSIHSHGSMGAFHSGTDDKDEINFDGLHITVGNVNGNGDPSFAVRWYVSGTELKGQLADAVEDTVQKVDYPRNVIDMCKKHVTTSYVTTYAPASMQNGGQFQGGKYPSEGRFPPHEFRFENDIPVVGGGASKTASKEIPKIVRSHEYGLDIDSCAFECGG